MLPKYNLLTRSGIRSIVLLVIVTISSCKKDQSENNKLTIDQAKSWYLKKTNSNPDHSTETEIKSTVSAMRVKPEALWNNSEAYQLSDGTEIVGVPLNIRVLSGMKTKGNYFMLITRDANGIKRTIVNDQMPEKSNESIASAGAIEKLYKGSVNLSLSHSVNATLKGGGNKLMNYQEQTCTDWYYTETTYDAYGNIIDYFEMYLWTECTDGGGGNSGGGGTTQTFDWGEPTDEDLDEQVTEDESSAAEIRYFTHRYRWTFHKQYNELFSCRSYEKGRTKLTVGPNQREKFISFEHLSAWPVGMPIGHEIEVITLDATTSFTNYTGYVNLWYKLHRKGSGFGVNQPAYSMEKTKDKTFSLAEYVRD